MFDLFVVVFTFECILEVFFSLFFPFIRSLLREREEKQLIIKAATTVSTP